MDSHILTQGFKININSIQTCLQCICNQLVLQILPCGCIGKNRCCAHILTEIIHQAPYFQAFLMCLHHIFPWCKAAHISIIIRNREPGRWDHIHPCHILGSIREIVVGVCTRNLMPCKIYRLIHREIRISFSFKTPLIVGCIRCTYFLFLDVSNISVICGYLIPVFSFVHQPENCIFCCFCQDLGFNPAPVPDHGILLYSYRLHIAEFILNCYSRRVFIYIWIDICIFLHIIQFQINSTLLQPYVSARLIRCCLLCKTGWCRIQDLFICTVPIISLIQISIYHIQRNINLISWDQSFLFEFLCSCYQWSLSICILTVILCQIHLLTGRNQFVNSINGSSYKRNQNDQQTYHQDRHMFFYHCFFPFGINVIVFFIITYFFCVSLQKSTFNKFSQFLYNFGSPHGMYEFRGTSASGEPLSLKLYYIFRIKSKLTQAIWPSSSSV